MNNADVEIWSLKDISRDWSTTTQAPTSPPPPIVLDPIMEEMMKMVNWTELEARFFYKKIGSFQWEDFWRFGGGEPQGLSVRNAFGSSFEEPEPTPAPYRSVPNHQQHLTPFARLLYLIGISLLLFFLLKAPNPIRASDSVWKFTLAMVKAGLKDSATGIFSMKINTTSKHLHQAHKSIQHSTKTVHLSWTCNWFLA